MARVNFIQCSQVEFNALTTKSSDSLYFVEDTRRIYKGSVDVTQNIISVSEFPETGVEGKLYINPTTLEVKSYQEDAWVTYLPGYATTAEELKSADNASKIPTSNAVISYVESVIESISQGEISGLAHNPTYDSSTMKLTIPVFGYDDVVVDLPKDNFVHSAYYDPEYVFNEGTDDEYTGPAIVLIVKTDDEADEGTKIAIPASSLVDVYTGTSTSTIKISVSDGNEISADLIIDTSTNEGELAVVTANGTIAKSAVTINSDAEAGMGSSTTAVPTESLIAEYVKAAINQLASTLLSEGNADEVVISTTNGITRSGVTIGSDTLAETPSAEVLATEAAVADAVSWKTLS